jgi:hypothetical protein
MAVAGLAALLPLYAYGEPAPVKEPPAKTPPATTSPAIVPAASNPKAPLVKTTYKPPLRGAPAGRVGGGTRGASERESFSLLVLAPDHVGYTIREQPWLYWFISKPTSYPIEFTIIERKAVKPLVEKILKAPDKAGVQAFCLADFGVMLRKNVQYKWFVTLVTDAEHRSKDILAGGILEMIDTSVTLAGKLSTPNSGETSAIFAEEGFWYDALESLSKLVDAAPNDEGMRMRRAALLEQVGLAEVADFEKRMLRPD